MISVTFLGQVHLLKKGLNDNVPDVCTTEQSLNSLKNPNGSFNRQAIISSQTTEVRNTVLSPPGFDKRAHGNLTITNISKHPISRSIEFSSPPPKRGYGGIKQDKEVISEEELRGPATIWGSKGRKGRKAFKTLVIIIHLQSAASENSASRSQCFLFVT